MEHRNDLVEGVDFYYTEDGLFVFTQKVHLERGYCCGNGCRHCPYHFENVPASLKKVTRQPSPDAQKDPR